MKTIPITKGLVALVDDKDFDLLTTWRWHASSSDAGWYAARRSRTNITVYMHRMIMLPDPDLTIDHINHDTLDNRRSNLRVCTHAENLRNQRSQRGVTSRYKGVAWHRRGQKWVAQITADGVNRYLGLYTSEREAAASYDRAAKELFGEFANTNFKAPA